MITNFMYPEKKKPNYKIVVPKEPSYFDNFEIFRLFTLIGCSISCAFYSAYLLSGLISTICAGLLLFMLIKMIIVHAIKQHNQCLRKLKKIYDTPIETIEGNLITYTFLAPSESLVKRITYLNKKLKKG